MDISEFNKLILKNEGKKFSIDNVSHKIENGMLKYGVKSSRRKNKINWIICDYINLDIGKVIKALI